MKIRNLSFFPEGTPMVSADLVQPAAVLFQPDVRIQLLAPDGPEILYSADLSEGGIRAAWLPRGEYRLGCHLHDLGLPAGRYRLSMVLFAVEAGERLEILRETVPVSCGQAVTREGLSSASWTLQSAGNTAPVEALGWNRGHRDPFFRRFDHAALVMTDYLMDRHPLLKGRILDAGCGDGATALGICARWQPEELVGLDPSGAFRRLPEIVAANHLPTDLLDDLLEEGRLAFQDGDSGDIAWPDDYFDVVLSWGALEHAAGGYEDSLCEIRRVLKKGGLFCVHPGLYYGPLGNHLGEFFDDPFIHLKLPDEELEQALLGDRGEGGPGGDEVRRYWELYRSLNPIRVEEFEKELRSFDFEPWRVALRSADLVRYTPELQAYSMQDLATAELYLSAWNRKP